MKKLLQILSVTLLTTLLLCSNEAPKPEPLTVQWEDAVIAETVTVEAKEYISTPVEQFVEVKTMAKATTMAEEDINLIALVTMAEAEGESEYGKRLVIDTILNRVDSENYPDTVYDVVYQDGQFTSMTNGRVDKCYVSEDICQLVKEELSSRTNYDTIYFHAGKYSKYGTPLFEEGNHYFSRI